MMYLNIFCSQNTDYLFFMLDIFLQAHHKKFISDLVKSVMHNIILNGGYPHDIGC
jgi:hypothetical protein